MKTYVLCASTDEDSINTLKRIRNDIDLKNAMVHIVNVVEIQVYNSELTPFVYPVENQYPAIEEATLNVLRGLSDSLAIDNNRLTVRCFFTHNREEKILEYLKEVNADLVVTATRGKHGFAGFFSSSFTDYLCKFSPCDVLAMRPAKN